MGQYWKPVNLDKREFIDPHKLGAGLKLWEQLANTPGTGAALLVLQACMPERRGGGDFQDDPVIGRWAGDRVVLVGDYSEDNDLLSSPIPFGTVYDMTYDTVTNPDGTESPNPNAFKDITNDVIRVIERELEGKFIGEDWRRWVEKDQIPETVAKKITTGVTA